MPCLVGKSILVSREALNAIGGIEVLQDHLAEDFLLGRLIRQAGFQVALSGDHVETAEVLRSWSGSWSRQRRWAILRKRLGGPGYTAEFLANPLPLCLATALTGRPEAAILVYAIRNCARGREPGSAPGLSLDGRTSRSGSGPRSRRALCRGPPWAADARWRWRQLFVGPATVPVLGIPKNIRISSLIPDQN
jgi:hypothetical protein